MKRLLPAIAVGMLLVGCSTPYQPKGFGGGYEEVELKPGVYFLSFRGNGYTSQATVMTYWHRRAKELCAERGQFPELLNATAVNDIAGAVGYTPGLQGGVGSVNVIRKATQTGYIQCVASSGSP
jgi:hypothetical protein